MHTPEFDEQFKELYAKGYSGIAIAEIMKIRFRTKDQWRIYELATAWMIRNVKRLGLPRRGRGYVPIKSFKQLRRIAYKKNQLKKKRIAQLQRIIPHYERQLERWREELALLTANHTHPTE